MGMPHNDLTSQSRQCDVIVRFTKITENSTTLDDLITIILLCLVDNYASNISKLVLSKYNTYAVPTYNNILYIGA